MMMSLGDFIFEVGTLPFEEMQRSTAWRHPGSNRVQAAPAYQFTGKGEETCSMSGRILPEVGSRDSLDRLREMADAGGAYSLVDGLGVVHGRFVITQITDNGSIFDAQGQPLRTEFSVTLTRVQDEPQDLAQENTKAGKGKTGKS